MAVPPPVRADHSRKDGRSLNEDEPRRKVRGTLLNYWNNLFLTSAPWLAENRHPTPGQTRLSGPGPRHALSHCRQRVRLARSRALQTRPPRFFPGQLALSPHRRGNPCGCPVVRGGLEAEAGKQGKDSWRQAGACQGILFKVWFRRCRSVPVPGVAAPFSLFD